MKIKNTMKYLLKYLYTFTIIIVLIGIGEKTEAQITSDFQEGIIRISEAGTLSDTLSVWGDVRTPGRYMVPRGVPVAKVLQYAGGPTGNRVGGNRNPWGKSRISISISQFDQQTQSLNYQEFNLRYNDEIPLDLRTYRLKNDDIIMVEVRQVPTFLDVLGVVGPILGTITTSYLFYDRFIR